MFVMSLVLQMIPMQYNSEKSQSEKSVTMCCKSKAVKDVYVPVFTPGLEPIAKVEHCQYLASIIKSLHVRGNMLIKKFHTSTVKVKL